jgi:hypothetical protein
LKGHEVVFNRGRGAGRQARADDTKQSGPYARDDEDQLDDLEEVDEGEADDDFEGVIGPYDSSDAPKGGNRLDLGSLEVPFIEDISMRFEANPEGQVAQLWLLYQETALQLSVCAAPRSEGLWDELRDELRESLRRDGASVREAPGVYGPELRAKVGAGAAATELRIVGIDGPRWLVQAVFQGPGAVDPDRLAGPLVQALSGLVVNRGPQALPVREQLPLRLPKDLQEAHAAELAARQANPQEHANGVPPARPAGTSPVTRRPPGGRRPSQRPRPNS